MLRPFLPKRCEEMGTMRTIIKKFVSVIVVISLFALHASVAFADFELSPDSLEEMNGAAALVLNVNLNLALQYKKDGKDGKAFAFPASADRIDLMDYSAERLDGIKAYLHDNAGFSGNDFTVDVITGRVKDEKRLQFLLFESTQEILRECGWSVTQTHNPEISYDASTGKVSIARFYLDYYAKCDKKAARAAVEEYTEALIGLLFTAFPDLKFEIIHICWQIPAVNKESLYAATFWCEYGKDGMALPEGSGLIYK